VVNARHDVFHSMLDGPLTQTGWSGFLSLSLVQIEFLICSWPAKSRTVICCISIFVGQFSFQSNNSIDPKQLLLTPDVTCILASVLICVLLPSNAQ
jgi:hypothetical protein